MKERRRRNLCYNCDELFRLGYKCKQQFMYFLLAEDEVREDDEDDEPHIAATDEDMTISVNALNGNTDFTTFRVKGRAYGQDIEILIDGGSTHCFLDVEAASRLGCALAPTTPMVEPQGLPPKRNIEHRITLKHDVVPKKMHLYRYSYAQKDEIESIVKGMLKEGIIQPSQSPFRSPVLLVKKKDGFWRMCVHYRYLNNLTVKYNFPIPDIDELLDELQGARYFSKIDLRFGYFQIRIADEDIRKTSFVTHQGHYEFLVMPFGLCNAPSTFQSLMNILFAPYLHKFILVFFYDILVYSKDWEDHLSQLRITLQLLREHQLFAKRTKCEFGKESIEYIGHIISFN
ncbi:UNVERIFIED_CONTAM: Transposon Ty3-G Gag-Pol polyprotein [Sesamum radiatum]|uniref:Transposon Ty3-G Gag-Pol polyprotein n=1 Tax=Sesamum radiatum TaxID=300843 RepID=A0AAW2PKL7_SESRA